MDEQKNSVRGKDKKSDETNKRKRFGFSFADMFAKLGWLCMRVGWMVAFAVILTIIATASVWFLVSDSNVTTIDGEITQDELKESLESKDVLLLNYPIIDEVSTGRVNPSRNSIFKSIGQLKVSQIAEEGVLAHSLLEGNINNVKSLLFKGASGYVDNDIMRIGLWKYDGISRYVDVNGIHRTIHSFCALRKSEAVRCYNEIVKTKKRIKEKKEAEAHAAKERQDKLAKMEAERIAEEARMRPILQKRRADYLRQLLVTIVSDPSTLVAVPSFLQSRIKHIKWVSPIRDIVAARDSGNMREVFSVISQFSGIVNDLEDELPEEEVIEKCWKRFIAEKAHFRFVIQFENVDDIGMLYKPRIIYCQNGSNSMRVSAEGVEDKVAGNGHGGFMCNVSTDNVTTKRYMLLDSDAEILANKADIALSKKRQDFEMETISKDEFVKYVNEIVDGVEKSAIAIINNYNGYDANGRIVDRNGTFEVGGKCYKAIPMSDDEISATKLFADEAATKFDFKLTKYLMIHHLINKAKRSIKVSEPDYYKLQKIKESGDGLAFFSYVMNGRPIITSNDVIHAVASLKERVFHFEIMFKDSNGRFGDPLIAKIDKSIGLVGESFNGVVPFTIGGPKSYIIESGSIEYFQKILTKLPSEEEMRIALEGKLALEVTYDSDIINRNMQNAAERERQLQEERAERAKEAAERAMERAEQKRLEDEERREKYRMKGPGGRRL